MSHPVNPPPPPKGNNAPEITLTTAIDDDNPVSTSGIVIVKPSSLPDIHITGK